MTSINGKTAVILGGGSGVGRELATGLAHAGAAVAVADIIYGNAVKVSDEIRASGGKAVPIYCNANDRSSISKLKQRVNECLGAVSLFVSNSSVSCSDPLVDMNDMNVDWIVQSNLMGVVNAVRAFLPDMLHEGDGHIVVATSPAGHLPGSSTGHALNSAANFGLVGFMMSLALEVKGHNVGTTTYCPALPSHDGSDCAQMEPESASNLHYLDDAYRELPTRLPLWTGRAGRLIRAIEKGRPFVFDEVEQKHVFKRTYADIIEGCYHDLQLEQGAKPRRSDLAQCA